MITILYTGASKFEEVQQNPALSLGGYISSSEVPNGYIGNLFGSISKYTVFQNKQEVRILAIKNVGVSPLTNIRIYTTTAEGNSSSILLGAGDPVVDECGDLYTPHIKSPWASPYNITFVTAEGFESSLPVGDLDPGDYFILFLKRVLSQDLQTPPSDEELLQSFEQPESNQVEDINLTVVWD